MATRQMLFSRFTGHFEGLQLHAKVWGELTEVRKHQPAVAMKGAIYTELRVIHDARKRCLNVWLTCKDGL